VRHPFLLSLSLSQLKPFAVFALRMAWRYFRSKKSAQAINVIAWISMAAIAVVSAALVVVLSVFNGFENLVIGLYADFYADVRVTAASSHWLGSTDSLVTLLAKDAAVRQAEPVLQERVMMIDDEDKTIVWLKGVRRSYALASGVANHMQRGGFELGTPRQPALVLGSGVENALQVTAGSQLFPLTVYFANRQSTSLTDPLEAMRSANAFASGSFAIQQDFDNQYAFTQIEFVRQMAQLGPQQSTAIELFLAQEADHQAVQRRLQKNLGTRYSVQTRLQQNQGLFAAMQGERLIIYGVAVLIMLIAAFNMVSSLTMTVLEKQHDIAVLQAMGATQKQVVRIFLSLGMLLAGVGGGTGLLLGLAICTGQAYFHWVKLGGQSFLIDYYPVAVRPSDLLFVMALVLGIALISGVLPSRKAATGLNLKALR
jgi:lipoprotein-releasing system permease protein